VYGEIRVTRQIQSREIEMALFVRGQERDADCHTCAQESWQKALASCPGCTLQPVKCQKDLPARYARLFDDVPTPSTYLSATASQLLVITARHCPDTNTREHASA
jgi:hypothetical protein